MDFVRLEGLESTVDYMREWPKGYHRWALSECHECGKIDPGLARRGELGWWMARAMGEARRIRQSEMRRLARSY